MTTPVYVVTGFLGSGKTTFISDIIRKNIKRKKLLIQFEEGEEEFDEDWLLSCRCRRLCWNREWLEQDFDGILEAVTEELLMEEYSEIWVEWNGLEDFSRLEEILLQTKLEPCIHIEKVIYLAEVRQGALLLGQTGTGPVSQAAVSDVAFLWREGRQESVSPLVQKLKGISPSLRICSCSGAAIQKEMKRKTCNQEIWLAGALLLSAFLFYAAPFAQQKGIPAVTLFTIFMGIFLQGVPFLLLGVLLSSAIQVFLPDGWMERFFPKNPLMGMAAGLLAGFFLPVCDCASIPVFQGLLKKGVPVSAAICFMAAAPVVNPVVLLSTYYAFGCDIRFVACRTGLGLLCAFLIGLSFLAKEPGHFLKGASRGFSYCACGCYEERPGKGFSGKLSLFFRHAQLEFYAVGKYLLAGIFISALFQVVDLEGLKALGKGNGAAAVLVMMVLAFVLSLCSSSDAVVARSMAGTFSYTAMLGFLVFGPMMDIKNVLMLQGYFRKGFVCRLAVTSFVVCFAVVLAFGALGGGLLI